MHCLSPASVLSVKKYTFPGNCKSVSQGRQRMMNNKKNVKLPTISVVFGSVLGSEDICTDVFFRQVCCYFL